MDISYISAQPDDYYFLWQIELQIYNFINVGIKPSQIHILIAFNEKKGLNPFFQKMIESNDSGINFFVYPDRRKDKRYSPSVRPFLLREYLMYNPSLKYATYFYHDSDILFREIIPFADMLENNKWYVSDTSSYLNSQYIINSIGADEFCRMCDIVGVSPEDVIASDSNCGGAQYLLKNTTIAFWEKVERDAISIYSLLQRINQGRADESFFETGILRSKFGGIQAWCADMWSLYWNAICLRKEVIVDSKLDFCWASEPIEKWNKTYILHYTGVSAISDQKKNVFRKTDYQNYPPYYDIELFSNVNAASTDAVVVGMIYKFLDERSKDKMDLNWVTFIIPVESEWRKENSRLLHIVIQLIYKHYKVEIIVVDMNGNDCNECDIVNPVQFRNISCRNLDAFISYVHKNVSSNFLFFYNPEIIFDPFALNFGRLEPETGVDIIDYCNHTICKVDTFLSEIFSFNLEPQFLVNNEGKLNKVISGTNSGGLLINVKLLNLFENNRNGESIGNFSVENLSKELRKTGVSVFQNNIELYELSNLINT